MKVLFAGSFNPFTIGHAHIVERTLDIFGNVTILFAINPAKSDKISMDDITEEYHRVKKIYEHDTRVNVLLTKSPVGEIAILEDCNLLVRGLRNNDDLEYEMKIANVNKNSYGIDTMFITPEPKYAWVSSSLVRDMKKSGVDTSWIIYNGHNL